jgi:hypothetical protein
MIRLLFILVFCFYSSGRQVSGQIGTKDNVWEVLLNEVKIKYVYAVNYGTYLPKPKFRKELKQLDGKEIILKGFFLPVDVTGSVFVLSYNPMNMCFFCTGSGIETILEMNVKADQVNKFKRLKTDDYIKVKGVLKLNGNDFKHLVYILNNVELIEIIE